jgi:hypothetical protein
VADEESIKSARLTPDENKFLEDNNLSFTDLMREAINKKQKEKKVHTKKQLVNKLIANGVYTIIGLALLMALNMSSNIFTIGIVGGLGAFFVLIGGVQLYLTIKEVGIDGGKRK